jgi:hypothetical protein
MNIAVFGWYHHRNAGDDRLQYCITRWLDGHTLAFLPAGRATPPTSFLRSYDAVLIGGGGILQKRGGVFRDMARWVKRARIPVALIGVSAERLPDDLRDELRSFLDVCCFAWFRDAASLEAVGPHPSAFVAPDLTWLYPYPVHPAGSGTAVSLRAGSGVPVEEWCRSLESLPPPVRPWPLYFESGADGRLLEAVLPGAAVPDEFTLQPMLESTVVVSSRYHALVFGLQSGREVLGVGGEPKVRRFLEEAGLGDWWLPDEALAALPTRVADLHRRSPLSESGQLRSRLHQEATDAATAALHRLADAVGRRR